MSDDQNLENLTDIVHKVADEINKKRGYFTTIPRWDVKTVLEAYFLSQVISEEIKNEVQSTDKQS
jgi:hypothetical protein